MDVSLDDFISTNKISARGRGNGRIKSRGRGLGQTRDGRIMKRSSINRPQAPRNMETSWKHDMFDGPQSRANLARNSAAGRNKLTISNLEFGVNDNDIKELFGEFGRLLKASVHYDRSGRSLGLAEVIYEKSSDALKAFSQYDGVPLDGRPMSIQIDGRSVAGVSFNNSRVAQSPRVSSFPRAARGAARTASGNTGRGRGRGRGPPPSKEDLDAELDKYISRMSNGAAD